VTRGLGQSVGHAGEEEKNRGLAASLSQPMGVGGCETKTIGYTCRSVALNVFGPGLNSRRLHQTRPSVTLPRGPLLSVKQSHWHCGSRETSQHKFFLYQYPV